MAQTNKVNFEELTKKCLEIAEALETKIKVDDDPRYDFKNIYFMTDPFGGDYFKIVFYCKTSKAEGYDWSVTNGNRCKVINLTNDTDLMPIVEESMKRFLPYRLNVYNYIYDQE